VKGGRATVVLAEPAILDHLVERPHLGCAYLIGACVERGWAVRLVRGQTRFLADMFLRDADELYALIMGLGDDEIRALNLARVHATLAENGPGWFAATLRESYDYTVAARRLRHFFDGDAGAWLGQYQTIAQTVIDHYLGVRGRDDLRIVERYVDEMLADDPDIVGFSLHGSFDALSRAVRRRIRARSDATIVVGGSHSSYVAAVGFTSRLVDHEAFDVLVVGEAERTLPDLIEVLEEDGDPVSVGNVYVCRDGQIVGGHAPPRGGLDELPAPDFDQFDLDLYAVPNRVLPVMTARGCSWRKCAFCAHHATYGGTYHGHSMDRFVEVVATLAARYECHNFVIQDEELPPARARKVAQALIDAGLDDCSYYTYGRLVKGYDDPDLAALLARAGFRSFQWGLESGSQRVLDLMCKGTEVPVMEKVLHNFAAAGIANQCFTFVGFPGETREEAQETVDFLERNRDGVAAMGTAPFVVSPMSPLHQHPEKWGVTHDATTGAYTVMSGLSQEEALAFVQDFMLKQSFEPQRWTSGVSCLVPGLQSRMLHFLCAAHGMLTRDVAAARLDGDAGDVDVFPLLVARPTSGGGEEGTVEVQPWKVWESLAVNRLRPPKTRTLSALERDTFERADGAHSLADIEAEVGVLHGDDADGGREAAANACRAFIAAAVDQGWALVFTRAWVPERGWVAAGAGSSEDQRT
jgi:radical SAM superfamily enzyme YgiQ (UPF0313 family)